MPATLTSKRSMPRPAPEHQTGCFAWTPMPANFEQTALRLRRVRAHKSETFGRAFRWYALARHDLEPAFLPAALLTTVHVSAIQFLNSRIGRIRGRGVLLHSIVAMDPQTMKRCSSSLVKSSSTTPALKVCITEIGGGGKFLVVRDRQWDNPPFSPQYK